MVGKSFNFAYLTATVLMSKRNKPYLPQKKFQWEPTGAPRKSIEVEDTELYKYFNTFENCLTGIKKEIVELKDVGL